MFYHVLSFQGSEAKPRLLQASGGAAIQSRLMSLLIRWMCWGCLFALSVFSGGLFVVMLFLWVYRSWLC